MRAHVAHIPRETGALRGPFIDHPAHGLRARENALKLGEVSQLRVAIVVQVGTPALRRHTRHRSRHATGKNAEVIQVHKPIAIAVAGLVHDLARWPEAAGHRVR